MDFITGFLLGSVFGGAITYLLIIILSREARECEREMYEQLFSEPTTPGPVTNTGGETRSIPPNGAGDIKPL